MSADCIAFTTPSAKCAFLTLKQIDEQLDALTDDLKMQRTVASSSMPGCVGKNFCGLRTTIWI